jgi:2-isopropylmalate synthase
MLNREQTIEIGPMSGKSNVIFWLERKGIDVTNERVDRIFNRAKQCDSVLTDEEVLLLV